MTQAKAATVVAALVTGGNFARAEQTADGEWVVFAKSPGGMVPVNTIKSFQDNQSITASVREAMFV